MRTRLLLATAALAGLGGGLAAAPAALAGPVPPACVVVDQAPVHAQVGYAPNGPADCTPLT